LETCKLYQKHLLLFEAHVKKPYEEQIEQHVEKIKDQEEEIEDLKKKIRKLEKSKTRNIGPATTGGG
jgi:uncharacterized protein Yka (UPF0111/DUF47 family)